PQRQKILRGGLCLRRAALREPGAGRMRRLHRFRIARFESRFFQPFGNLEAMRAREALEHLHAAAVAMHIAESADVHEDVEFERLARGKLAQQFVVTAAMTRAQRYDFVAALLTERVDTLANLTVGVVAGSVEQRRG